MISVSESGSKSKKLEIKILLNEKKMEKIRFFFGIGKFQNIALLCGEFFWTLMEVGGSSACRSLGRGLTFNKL